MSDAEDDVEAIVKSVMTDLDLKVKKVRAILHISKGIDAIEMKFNDPLAFFVPGGTFILMLTNVEWIGLSPVVGFEFINITFEIRKGEVEVLATKIGLQGIDPGTTRELAEARELELSNLAVRGIKIMFDTLSLREDIRKRLEKLFKGVIKKKK